MGYKLGDLTVKSAAGTTVGKTKLTVTPEKEGTNSYVYRIWEKSRRSLSLILSVKMVTANGTELQEITAKEGDKILVVWK